MSDFAEMMRLREAVKRNEALIGKSNVFLSIFSSKGVRDPAYLLQLGLAVMLDKPIYVLADKNEVLPTNLVRAARAVAVYDADIEGDFDRATKTLVEWATKDFGGGGDDGCPTSPAYP